MRELIFDKVTNGNLVYMDVMELILGDTPRNSMIDLGAHHAAHTPLFKFKERRYVDILPNVLDHPEEQKYFVQADILDTPLDKHYDVAFSLDSIEHLTVPDGFKLIDIMNEIADKKILFTPLTNLFGFDYVTNDPEAHRSLWQPEMFEGYAAITFPNYHKIWDGGAFFVWHCDDMEKDFYRIANEINKFSWAK